MTAHETPEMMKTYQERANLLIQEGHTAKSNGRVDEAIRAYRAAIDLIPAYGSLHLVIADMLFEKKDYSAASAAYRDTVSFFPEDDQAWAGLGQCQLLLNAHDEALRSFLTAREVNPQNPEANYYGALLAARSGDDKTAEKMLVDALASRPSWELQAREEAQLKPLFERSRRLKSLTSGKKWWEIWK